MPAKTGQSLSLGLKLNVKNTFIDVGEGGLTPGTGNASFARQCTEPVPTVGISPYPSKLGESAFEMPPASEMNTGPEVNSEPSTTDLDVDDLSLPPRDTEFARQDTEQNWPTWDEVHSMKAAHDHLPVIQDTPTYGSLPPLNDTSSAGHPTWDALPAMNDSHSTGHPTWGSLPAMNETYSASPTCDMLPEMNEEESESESESENEQEHTGTANNGYGMGVWPHAGQMPPMGQMMMPVPVLVPYAGMMAPDSQFGAEVTTVMMRNLPNKVSRVALLAELESEGFCQAYDFVYLPIDPGTKANRGYAFLNFLNAHWAAMFKFKFEGRMFQNYCSSKVVRVMPAAIQGFEDNYAHYSKLRVNQRPLEERPLFLRAPAFKSPARRGQRLGASKYESSNDRRRKTPLEGRKASTSEGEVDSAGVASSSSSSVAHCTSCGKSGVEAHFKFCQHCGAANRPV